MVLQNAFENLSTEAKQNDAITELQSILASLGDTLTADTVRELLLRIYTAVDGLEISLDTLNLTADQVSLDVDGVEGLLTSILADLELKADKTEAQPVSLDAAAQALLATSTRQDALISQLLILNELLAATYSPLTPLVTSVASTVGVQTLVEPAQDERITLGFVRVAGHPTNTSMFQWTLFWESDGDEGLERRIIFSETFDGASAPFVATDAVMGLVGERLMFEVLDSDAIDDLVQVNILYRGGSATPPSENGAHHITLSSGVFLAPSFGAVDIATSVLTIKPAGHDASQQSFGTVSVVVGGTITMTQAIANVAWHTQVWAEGTLFKASLTNPAADQANIATWHDESGTARNFTQASASSQPTYRAVAASLNSKPALDWLGTASMKTSAFVEVAHPFTVVFIASIATPESSQRLLEGRVSGALPKVGILNSKYWVYAGSNNYVSDPLPDSDQHLFVVEFNTSSSKLLMDGTQVMGGNFGSQGIDGIFLGSAKSGGANFTGHIAFFGLFVGTLTTQQKQDLLDAAVAHYGITP